MKVTLDHNIIPDFDDELHQSSGNIDAEQALYRDKVFDSDRKFTLSGREAIRKNFTTNVPVELPAGHATVAFSEGQIHTILRTLALISLFHMMKSLLIKVTEGIPLDKRPSRNLLRRADTPGPDRESSSGGDSSAVDNDVYTSGALNSDEDFRYIETASGTTPPAVSASKTLDTSTTHPDQTRVFTPNSGSSYSSWDNRPLAFLAQA